MTSINVDPSEVKKFESLAHKWWDKSGEFKPLHEINPLRANYIDERSNVAEKTLLDVGCGGGILTEAMAQRGAIVTGIDMGDAPLEVAKLHKLESGLDIHYEKSTAENFAQQSLKQNRLFDIVTCLEMLEHVPDPESVIKACFDLAKPGAHVYFSTLNRNPKSYLFAIIGAEYILNMLPKGTHDYQKFIKPSELAQYVRNANGEVKEVTGMTYNPITKHYAMKAYDVDVNYIVHCIKPT